MKSFYEYLQTKPEKLRSMVDSAASRSGYSFGPFWHQTKKQFYVFDVSNTFGSSGGGLEYRIPNGIYLKSFKDPIFIPGSIQMMLFAKINSPLRINDRKELSEFLRKRMKNFDIMEDNLKQLKKTGIDSISSAPNLHVAAKELQNKYNEVAKKIKKEVTSFFKKTNFDGIIMNDDNGILTTIVFEPSQVKLADLVTYDTNNKIIPISQRFDANKDDIRY